MCATDDEIDKWIKYKTFRSRLLNQKINFDIWDKYKRENETWIPVMPLQRGKYTDGGFRFRKNLFNMNDSWVPAVPST